MLNMTKDSITKGNTITLEQSQLDLETELLKQGYNRSLALAAGEYVRAQQGGLVTSLPRGKVILLETLNGVNEWLTALISKVISQRGKPKFYTVLIEPFMAMWLKEEAKCAQNAYHTNRYENPINLLGFFMTRELTKSMIVEDRLATEVARRIVNSYVMSYNRFDEATEEELVGMIQLVRTYLLSEQNKFFNEWSASNGIHIGLNEEFSTLFLTKEDLLSEVPDDKSPYKPMLVKPVEHKNLIEVDGGYLTLQSPLLKNSEIDIIRQLPFNSEGDGKEWFKAVNDMQNTAWKVNTPFLQWLQDCNHPEVTKYFNTDSRKMQLACNKRVAQAEYAIRKLSKEIQNTRYEMNQTNSQEAKVEMSRKITNIADEMDIMNADIQGWKSEVGKARGWEETITDAKFYSQFEEFYHPVFADNRGRIYTYNTSLTFQGSMLSKCLIEQKQKQKLTQEGLDALYELLGGMFDGWSKKKKEARIAMVHKFKDAMFECIQHKNYGIIELIDGDEILMALNIMFILYNHSLDENYETGSIAYIDSTSSAIQVQALAQRCVKAASLTNLIESEGSDLPDAYKAVAENCKELVDNIAKQDNNELYATMVLFLMENKPEQVEYTGIKINA